MVNPLLHDKSADLDNLAHELTQPIDRAVGVPSDVVVQFQGMTTDIEAK